MNALLFLPGLLFLLVRNAGIARAAAYILAGVALQLAIGAPFLLTHPGPYMAKAFEMSRVFFHAWTVNWKMLPEDVFVSQRVATGLLLAHAGALICFGAYRWCEHDGGLVQVLARVGVLPRAAVPALQRAAELLGLAPLAASQQEPAAAAAIAASPAAPPSPLPSLVRANSERDDPMNGSAGAAGGAGSGTQQLRGAHATANANADAAWDASVAVAAGTSAADAGSSSPVFADNGWGSGSIVVASTASDGSGNTSAASSAFGRGAFVDGPAFIAYVLFASNFAGIAFARTLHYQFYTWYFHSLPLLAAAARLPAPVIVVLLAGIEYAFNVGDAAGAGSALSSTVLQLCHFALLGALLSGPPPNPRAGVVVVRPGQSLAGCVAAGKKQA